MHSLGGYFVAVCGIDGSGKTTQIEHIERALSKRGEVVQTRQPTDMYRQDRVVRDFLNMEVTDELVVPEIALFAAFDRLRHVRETIRPALDAGKAVVSDRYMYTGYSYMMARGSELEWLRQLYRYLVVPHLTIYIDVPPEIAIERIIRRDGTSRKREEIDLTRMTKVRENFLSQPWGESPTYVIIDGTVSQEDVTDRVLQLVNSRDPRP